MTAQIDGVYGHRSKSSVSAVKLVIQRGEIAHDSSTDRIWMRTFDDRYICLSDNEYSPLSYDADVSGTNDSGPAIQEAYDAAKASVNAGLGTGGALVRLPGNRLKVNTAVLFDSPFVTVVGSGPTATEFFCTGGSGTSLVTVYGGAAGASGAGMQSHYKDFKITHLGGDWDNLLHLYNVSYVTLMNIWVEGSWDDGNLRAAKFESALVCNVLGCTFRYGDEYALDISKIGTGVTGDGNNFPNVINILGCSIIRGGLFGLRYRDGEHLKLLHCDIEGNGKTADTNHGAVYIVGCGIEAGIGACVVMDTCWMEGNKGIHVKVGALGFSVNYVHLKNVHAIGGGGDTLYGIWCDVTAPALSRVRAESCTFFNASIKDYYFANNAIGDLYDCEGMTSQLTGRCMAAPVPGTSTNQIPLDRLACLIEDWTDNANTKIGAYYGPIKNLNNSTPVDLRSVTSIPDGAELILYSNNGSTTIKHRYSGSVAADEFDCPGGSDYTPETNEILRFIRKGNHFYPAGQGGTGNRYVYKEGLYVATLTTTTSGTITVNASRNNLSWTRRGREVHVFGRVDVSGVSSPVGGVRLNLPFTAASGGYELRSLGQIEVDKFTMAGLHLRIQQGATHAELLYNNAGTLTLVNAADFDGDEELNVNFTYPV